jgi:hypothetical protein
MEGVYKLRSNLLGDFLSAPGLSVSRKCSLFKRKMNLQKIVFV